ncbi:S9 family peptidase [Saccharopolyspora rhizosphaerae]|uniref:S9 family peptidase n=1 Tax=Saccharopolyspora rhizosphaerae TaxID=2492662 RepID=A0A3R8QLI6_9PSEU|nr:S9 family peptidase [Saccharopolyspora rhizosphaerae]RRO15114.1 S9 family peptidase [Saccharopolyspora rhizosphaerae]
MTLEISRLLELTTWRVFDVADDGRVLAGCDESGSVQLVELAEGGCTELTALAGAVVGRYLPGERAVVVQHDSDGDERGQLSLLRLDDRRSRPAPLSELEPLVRDSEHVHRLLDVLPGRIVYATNRRNGVDFDVVIRSVTTGEEHVVHDGGGMVAEVAISPDSRFAAITVPATKPLSDQVLVADTMPETGADQLRELTDRDLAARHLHPGWQPGGLVVTTDAGRDRTGVARLDPRTGGHHWLVTSDEHDLSGRLSPNGRTLLVLTAVDGAHRAALHEAATGEHVVDIALPSGGWCGYPLPEPVWSPDSRFAALSFSSPSTPGDVLLVDTATGTCTPLTSSAAQLAEETLVEPTVHRVPARDGEQIPCFRYAPAAPDGSAVLLIHGGPESQSVRSFHPLVQAMVSRGHTVLVPNVRGSTGYGKRWYSADDARNRLESVQDLADLHRWLPSVGLDPSRAALWGGSYGGYMVLAGLAFQPELWAAGVDVVGISSLVTFLENTAPYRRAHREREYGSLIADADFLREASPLNRASAIAAPLFVLHGANDPRVPLTEAEQIVEAVRANGVAYEFHVYPDEGHGLAKRANRLDAYPKALAFLSRHLG